MCVVFFILYIQLKADEVSESFDAAAAYSSDEALKEAIYKHFDKHCIEVRFKHIPLVILQLVWRLNPTGAPPPTSGCSMKHNWNKTNWLQ